MLMEEERFITEANNAAKLSAEIAQFQKETRMMKQNQATSMIMDPKRTEPLITKAYNAFR